MLTSLDIQFLTYPRLHLSPSFFIPLWLQKNLQTLTDLEKLKDHYYQEYMEALRAKIDKQKLKIKKKEDILTKKINKREEKKVRSE